MHTLIFVLMVWTNPTYNHMYPMTRVGTYASYSQCMKQGNELVGKTNNHYKFACVPANG